MLYKKGKKKKVFVGRIKFLFDTEKATFASCRREEEQGSLPINIRSCESRGRERDFNIVLIII